MRVRDCEYYEARAKDVKLGDITSDEYNAGILAMLRDNDPTFTSILISIDDEGDFSFQVREGDDLGWLGYFLGKNDQVKRLYMDFPNDFNLKHIDEFFRGLGRNRSIEMLYIGRSLGESFQGLVPFLSNNSSLRDLEINSFDIGLECARSITLLLGQQSSLKCLNFEGTNLGDAELIEISSALRKQPQLEELTLNSNNIGRDGCVALGSVLEGLRSPNLSILDLDDNVIDDEGLCALTAGLKNCHNLTSLNLSENGGIRESGFRSLSTLFQSEHCRLEHLDLDRMNIDNDGVAALSTGMTSLMSLKRLNLWSNRISDLGVAGGLVNCCNIEELDLSSNMLSESALSYLASLVQRATQLKSLILLSNAINDEGLLCMVDGMTQHCSLTRLDLSHNSITAVGLRSLARFLRSDNCRLKKLVLYDIDFGDEGAAALADGLRGNTSLQNLHFSEVGSSITAMGWAAFSKLLCDTSSVNNTYLSNHTLVEIGDYGRGVPSDLAKYLKFNRAPHQFTAIRKILYSHPDIDMEPLLRWKLKCLPQVVSWLEKVKTCWSWNLFYYLKESTESIKCRQLSAIYKFVRGMPLLTAEGCRSRQIAYIELKSKKRKFDQTLTL